MMVTLIAYTMQLSIPINAPQTNTLFSHIMELGIGFPEGIGMMHDLKTAFCWFWCCYLQ